MYEVIQGDSVDELALFPDSTFDSLVCDPPCGIDLADIHWDSSYGGREGWIALHQEIFREALRTMKPGAYGLAWALPRTSHWTATALENAGFEVRDVITHLYASGMPKGQAVDKLIDRKLGAEDERDVVDWKEVPDYSRGGMAVVGGGGPRPKKVVEVTRAATELARRFEGWQTTLRPAAEPWILVRKPYGGSNVDCLIEHGTGALNVPGCRVDGKKWPPNAVWSHAEDCDPEGPCAPGCPAIDLGKAAKHYPSFRFQAKPTKKERTAAGENKHPTLKPVDLMRWMVRLVTPAGGHVLDVFGGSGTTGVGAVLEGFDATVIEREAEFADVCRRRLAWAEEQAMGDLLG